jgi:AAA+ superfamily predicted ATPase/ATP-dependent Clp protease adapter protein ClpS
VSSQVSQPAFYEIVIHNDQTTPFQFISGLISRMTGVPLYEAQAVAQRIHVAGKHVFGPYSPPVAEAFYNAAREEINLAGHPLVIEMIDLSKTDESGVKICSFCGKASTAVSKMFAGQKANICSECVARSAGELASILPTARVRFIWELLDWHFGDRAIDEFVKTIRTYPGRVRADLQVAVEALFDANAVRTVGFKQQYGYEKCDLSSLWRSGRDAMGVAPISYEELDIGEGEPKHCQINGLWMLVDGDDRYAAVMSREQDYHGGYSIYLEISGPQGAATTDITRKVFDSIEEHIRKAQSYRGKVLSLEQAPHYAGSSTGITVHKMDPVNRDQIILPEKTLEEIDRTIIRFCKQRDQLRRLGLQTKRGVMFWGAPGTGKTHTIRYLASQLSEHTTFLVTAEQIGLLPEYFSLARLLQPVIFVIEDADLLAKSREMLHGATEEMLLNHLLNEMDGLKEDADILFVLSTNKPEVLEQALIARPGRIDQLIEFPLPDEDCRRALMDLYGGNLSVSNIIADDVVSRTHDVSASFIKELMRRFAQYSIERGRDGDVNAEDVDQALNEMLFDNSRLNRSVLGAHVPENQ